MSNQEKPKVKKETKYTYTNKFNKKQIEFTPKPDEVVATFQPQPTEDVVRETMSATSLAVSQGINYGRGFAVFQTAPEQDVNKAAETLSAQPQIANAIPAFVDDEGKTRYFLPDEFTVQFLEGVSKEQAEKIIKEHGSRIVVQQRTPGYYTLAVPEGKGLFETLREFSALQEVAFAEPSEAGFNDALAYFPDDPDFPKLWGLHNTGQVVSGVAGTADADIDATEAWDITRGHPDVIMAVIDTGADMTIQTCWLTFCLVGRKTGTLQMVPIKFRTTRLVMAPTLRERRQQWITPPASLALLRNAESCHCEWT